MGPACHPLCAINFLFLEFFLAPHIWSLAFFFRSPAASQTVIPLLLNGTHMSSSMYNQVSFLELFLAPDIWSLAFFFRSHATLRTLQAHGTRMSSSMYNKISFLGFFLAPDIWSLAFFSFDLMPRLKLLGTCWLMGPACHPLCAIKVYFLWFFFTLWFLSISFFLLMPCRLGNVE